MIHFDSEANVFHLFNRDISYVIHLNGFGRLETLYFGEKLNNLSDILKSRIVYPDNTYLDKKMSIMTPSPAYFYPESLQKYLLTLKRINETHRLLFNMKTALISPISNM